MKNTIKFLALTTVLCLAGTAQAREFVKAKVVIKASYTSVSTGTVNLVKSKGYIIRSDDGAFCEMTLKTGVVPCKFVINSTYVRASDISHILCSTQKWCAPLQNAQPASDGSLDLYPKGTSKIQLHTNDVSEAFHIRVKVEKFKLL